MWDDTASRRYYDAELPTRASRPLGNERNDRLQWFVNTCRDRQLSSVIEVGAGAGRDGLQLRDAGLSYVGVDLSDVGVAICRQQGLTAVTARATDLPFSDDAFDAGWSMSTLMHLPDHELTTALNELRRVLRPGGVLAVGLWGSTTPGARIDEHHRLFQQHTDEQVRSLLGAIGTVLTFDTWSWFEDGGHYQWAAVEVSEPE